MFLQIEIKYFHIILTKIIKMTYKTMKGKKNSKKRDAIILDENLEIKSFIKHSHFSLMKIVICWRKYLKVTLIKAFQSE